MGDTTNSVFSKMTDPNTVSHTRKCVIVSDLSRDTFELSKRMMRIFYEYDTKIIFYSVSKDQFLDGDEIVSNIEEMLTNAALVFNFISVKEQAGRDVSRIIEKLNIDSVQNSLSTRMVFFAKNTIKRILESYSLKTPVFEFVGRKSPGEAFSDFIQPSRIFSAENHFFSDKLDSLESIQAVYEQVGEDISGYFIEEYIEGLDIYSFVFRQDGKTGVYSIRKRGDVYVPLEQSVKSEISEYAQKVFSDTGIEKFALIHTKKTEKRGIFILNIFVEWEILMREQGEVMGDILEQESIGEKELVEEFITD